MPLLSTISEGPERHGSLKSVPFLLNLVTDQLTEQPGVRNLFFSFLFCISNIFYSCSCYSKKALCQSHWVCLLAYPSKVPCDLPPASQAVNSRWCLLGRLTCCSRARGWGSGERGRTEGVLPAFSLPSSFLAFGSSSTSFSVAHHQEHGVCLNHTPPSTKTCGLGPLGLC